MLHKIHIYDGWRLWRVSPARSLGCLRARIDDTFNLPAPSDASLSVTFRPQALGERRDTTRGCCPTLLPVNINTGVWIIVSLSDWPGLMASWCRYIRHPTQLCGLWTPPFVVNNRTEAGHLSLESEWIFLKQVKYQQWPSCISPYSVSFFGWKPAIFSARTVMTRNGSSEEGGRGSLGALTCEYLTSDVRVLGPEVSINSRFLSCQQNISWAAAPIRPFPPQQLFIFTQWTRHQSSSRSYFLLGKIWLHCTAEINVEVSYFSYSLSNGGIVFL